METPFTEGLASLQEKDIRVFMRIDAYRKADSPDRGGGTSGRLL
jgi:hypothetical protein